jgi:hypothetical protein
MNLNVVGRRMGLAVSIVAVSLILAVTFFSGTAYAPPGGAAPVNIADPETPSVQAQVTEDGELQVTGNVALSGTSEVEVTNTPLPVDVENFPENQDVTVTNPSLDVEPEVATTSFVHRSSLDDGEEELVALPSTIDASLILLTTSQIDDEFLIEFFGPGIEMDFVLTEQNVPPVISIPLNERVPISSVFVLCANESIDCGVLSINIVGD